MAMSVLASFIVPFHTVLYILLTGTFGSRKGEEMGGPAFSLCFPSLFRGPGLPLRGGDYLISQEHYQYLIISFVGLSL